MFAKRLAAAALTAPTGDNCQPFTFAWDGEGLDVFVDEIRARHRLDAGRTGTLLSLGAAMEAMDAVASAENQGLDFELRGPGAGAWLRITPRSLVRSPSALAPTVWARACDRRPYAAGDPRDPELLALAAMTHGGARVHLCPLPNRALQGFVLDADRILWQDLQCLRDAMPWMRLTDEEILRTRDGMPWVGAGLSRPETYVVRATRRIPGLLETLAAGPGPLGSRRLLARQLRGTTACVLVSASAPAGTGTASFTEIAGAGRLAMRAWLELNRAGFGVQPLSLASLCVYNRAAGVLPSDAPSEVGALLDRGPAILQAAFGLPAGALPLWMFRTGRSAPLPPRHRAHRLPVDAVFRTC